MHLCTSISRSSRAIFKFHGREITKNLCIIHFSGNGPDVGFDGQDGKIPGI